MPLTRRDVFPVVLDRLRDDTVVLLEGPRSVGKSTLLRQLAAHQGGRLLDLDVAATRTAVAADPATFVAGEAPVFIDEYHKVPEVLEAIKAELNVDDRPGRYVLTGSMRHDSLPITAESLTGRLSRLRVDPLAQNELAGTAATFVDALFGDPASLVRATPSATTRLQYVDIMLAGGFPLALRRGTVAARNRWLDEYIRLILERDVTDLSRVRQGHLLRPLLAQVAAQTAGLLNVERIVRALGQSSSTVNRYLDLLERVFLYYQLPAWGTTLSARTSKAPKAHVLDSAVAARLLRLTADKLAAADPSSLAELGHLLETFVVGEIRKQAQLASDYELGHWRTRDDTEVDLVIERGDGTVVGIEVKTSAQVSGSDFSGLSALRSRLGTRFAAGVVLTLGTLSYAGTDSLFVMPVDRIWTP